MNSNVIKFVAGGGKIKSFIPSNKLLLPELFFQNITLITSLLKLVELKYANN